MACDQRTSSIFVEAASVSFGARELSCITGATGLTGGESFLIASPTTSYQVWIDINNASTAPTPSSGETLVEVDVPTSYTISDLNSGLITALEATNDFYVTESSDGLSVSVQNIYLGAVNAALADVDTAFTFEVDKTGYGGDLGRTSEGIEISFNASTLDITSNQTGELLLDQIIQSTGASLSMSLLNTTKENLTTVLGNGFGDSVTPSGGTEVVGFGTSKQFQSAFDLGGQLVLHPIRLDASDRSRDVTFWQCLPLPESIVYDGTSPQTLSVSFTALVDDNINSAVSVFSLGDWTQDLRA